MNSWAPLSNGLVDSSIWEEEDHVFRVFMAMLSLKDHDHVVSMDGYKLAKRIHMPIERVLDALKVLAAPDSRRPGQEFDGRRVEAVEDGWKVLQGEFYRSQVSKTMKLARNRRAQAAYRERKKRLQGTPLPGETAAVAAMGNGDQSGADAITTAALPATSPEDQQPIPELPTRDQQTEPGNWVDGEWVPD